MKKYLFVLFTIISISSFGQYNAKIESDKEMQTFYDRLNSLPEDSVYNDFKYDHERMMYHENLWMEYENLYWVMYSKGPKFTLAAKHFYDLSRREYYYTYYYTYKILEPSKIKPQKIK